MRLLLCKLAVLGTAMMYCSTLHPAWLVALALWLVAGALAMKLERIQSEKP